MKPRNVPDRKEGEMERVSDECDRCGYKWHQYRKKTVQTRKCPVCGKVRQIQLKDIAVTK